MTATLPSEVPQQRAGVQERRDRLTAGAQRLASRRSSLVTSPRFLLGLSSSLMTGGVSLVLLGWLGVARSTIIEEQLPYLVSGGLLGLALTTVGAAAFFAHWITAAHSTARAAEVARQRDHQELLLAVQELTSVMIRQEVSDDLARSPKPERPLRRSPRSS